MTLVLAWIGLPLVLSLLCLGCGLLLETVSGMRLPGALVLPGGLIVISLAALFAHMSDTTAPLQTPFVVALSLAGYGVSRPWKRFHLDRWLALAAAGVYAVFLAPVVLSGRVTFTGYIKLDDTATYMSVLDRALAHAYNLYGLNSSTYEAVLFRGYKFGYPLGSLLPLDVAHTLLRVDQLWLWQPYMTFLAVMIAIGLYQLASGLVQSRVLRACVAFFGTQAALIYGYALWGGIKELFAAGVLLFAACLVPRLKDGGPRQVIPLAAAAAAVIGGLSVGGGIWIVPLLVVGLTLLVVYRPPREIAETIAVFTLTALFLAIPMLSVSGGRLNHLGKFMKGGENGNLLHPLSWWQVFGIWPSGDFRATPTHLGLTRALALLVAAGAIFAVVVAWRRKRWEVVVALATAVFACLIYVERASPWVAGKSLAVSSPLVLGIGLIGVAVVIESRRQVEGGIALALLAVIAGGVLWSNAMQYHAVLLAPSTRLAELETIGNKFANQGPALLTEYEPYGARHLLRGLSAESPAELRVRNIFMRKGGYASPGVSPDVDEIRIDQVLMYPTLIIRRTGSASRPPSAYSKVWSGQYYDVWQRPAGQSQIFRHLSLGSRYQPAGVPDCAKVMDLAQLAADRHGLLATVYRPKVAVVDPLTGQIKAPTQFGVYGEPSGLVHATNAYTLKPSFRVRSAGTYGVWVGGSFSSTLAVKIDGRKVGQQWNQTQWPGNFVSFGSVVLRPGLHTLALKHSGPDLLPGTAAVQPFGLGPVVIAQGTDQRNITYVQPSAAHSLCGKTLDWVEALQG